jgi:hypothetical protein
MAMPAFIAFAASRTSGTNRMPSRKSMPTMRMPSTSASFRTLSGPQPRPSRMFVPSTISGAMPSYRSLCICSTSSSSASADEVERLAALVVLARVGGHARLRSYRHTRPGGSASWNDAV